MRGWLVCAGTSPVDTLRSFKVSMAHFHRRLTTLHAVLFSQLPESDAIPQGDVVLAANSPPLRYAYLRRARSIPGYLRGPFPSALLPRIGLCESWYDRRPW